MYEFLTKYPDKISHYIIKIDISFLLIIPEQTSKRLVNSDEYFYLNLIELKERFEEIQFTPSQFIQQIKKYFYDEYITNINKKKIKKLNTLKVELSKLYKKLIKLHDSKIPFLVDYIEAIYKNLNNEINEGKDTDQLIEKYISNVEKRKKLNLKEILNKTDENQNYIPEFNYLYLTSINYFDELNVEDIPIKNTNSIA